MVQRYLAHPWVLDIPINGSPATPNTAAWLDAGLAALADTSLTHEERVAVMLLVTGQARWTGIVLASYARIERERRPGAVPIGAEEDARFRLLITADAIRTCEPRSMPGGYSPPTTIRSDSTWPAVSTE